MTIRTILVDDEPLATQGLQLRLLKHEDVEIIDTCSNGREAIRSIKTHKPDLVFLDIQMPGFDGFSVIQGLMEVEPPLFVFVTAYGDHALRAFQAQAVDYLMKPVEEDRLADTLDRIRQRLSEKRGAEEAGQAEGGSRRSRSGRRQRRERGCAFIEPLREAHQHQGPRPDLPRRRRHDREDRRGRRLYVHLYRRQHADPARNDEGSRKAPRPRRFQRVHRSTIVNLDLVRQVKPHTNGECFLVLDSGSQVKVSRSYRDVVARFVH
jgi:two-component system LytT family response regulator